MSQYQQFQEQILAPIGATFENLQATVALISLLLEDLPQTRDSLLRNLANLSRTFYHTNMVSYLRMSSVATDTFKEEFLRAYWRGVSERKRLIPALLAKIKECQGFLEKEENLRRNRGVLEKSFISDQNPRGKISKNVQELLISIEDNYEQERVRTAEKVAFEFVEHAEDAIQKCRLLHVDFIEPVINCTQLEIQGIQKITDSLEVRVPTSKRVELGDLARTADVLSWGLQEFDMETHLETGRKDLQSLKESLLPRLETTYAKIKKD
ncbi:MAG: hypothetical protein ACXACI_03905 [Candidatus Hodarchaeales archaeon]